MAAFPSRTSRALTIIPYCFPRALGAKANLISRRCRSRGRVLESRHGETGRHTERDGNCVTYRQRAGDHQTTVRSADDPCPRTGLQLNLRIGQSDHRAFFGPFPSREPGHRARARSRCWSGSSSSNSSSSSRGTTHEECGAGEDADVIFRSHRLMLSKRVNGSKTLFGYTLSFLFVT